MTCPKCGFNGTDSENCPKCGVNFVGYNHFLRDHNPKPLTVDPVPEVLNALTQKGLEFLGSAKTLFVKQHEDALRVVTGWQTLNHYSIQDGDGNVLALLAERDQGFFKMVWRHFFRNRRSLIIDIFDPAGAPVAQLTRPFYWFFSDVFVEGPSGSWPIGVVKRRFSFWLPQYDLCSAQGATFGHLKCPIIGGATLGGAIMGNRNYNVYDARGVQTKSSIMRVWNGLMRIFTDEDTYCVELGDNWSADQKLIILAAAIAIDFDSFEGDTNLIKEGTSFFGLGSILGSGQSNSDGGS